MSRRGETGQSEEVVRSNRLVGRYSWAVPRVRWKKVQKDWMDGSVVSLEMVSVTEGIHWLMVPCWPWSEVASAVLDLSLVAMG